MPDVADGNTRVFSSLYVQCYPGYESCCSQQELLGIDVNTDEFVSKMIVTAGPENLGFGDWTEVLYAYAAVLERIEARLTVEETHELVGVGGQFYRTLARAEDYRRTFTRNSSAE